MMMAIAALVFVVLAWRRGAFAAVAVDQAGLEQDTLPRRAD